MRADAKDGAEQQGHHRKWDGHHGRGDKHRFRHDVNRGRVHGSRRDGHHEWRRMTGVVDGRHFRRDANWPDHGLRRDGRHEWKGYNERRDDHRFGRNVSHGNRGHHNKPEIREDFQKIREARRNEVRQDRGQLRKDYRELKREKSNYGKISVRAQPCGNRPGPK